MMVNAFRVYAFRARRQYLAPESRGRSPEEALAIIRALQPFSPAAGAIPGSPPDLRARLTGCHDDWVEQWRGEGKLIKGRFMKGNIAYVVNGELDLYAAAFRRPLREPPPLPERQVLDMLERGGPLLKSELRSLANIDLHRLERGLISLNQAFEIMEMQREPGWDNLWDIYRRAYPDANPYAWDQRDAQAEVVRRFTQAFGPATVREIADWSGWSQRMVREIIGQLLKCGDVAQIGIAGREEPAYISCEDVEALESAAPIRPFTTALAPNDPFVLPQWSSLNDRFRPYPLPYCYGVIAADGELVGAAWGHYKRAYIHIEELSLAPEIAGDPRRASEALTALEAHVIPHHVSIHIYGINGVAEAPWIIEIFERNGFLRETGYFVKERS